MVAPAAVGGSLCARHPVLLRHPRAGVPAGQPAQRPRRRGGILPLRLQPLRARRVLQGTRGHDPTRRRQFSRSRLSAVPCRLDEGVRPVGQLVRGSAALASPAWRTDRDADAGAGAALDAAWMAGGRRRADGGMAAQRGDEQLSAVRNAVRVSGGTRPAPAARGARSAPRRMGRGKRHRLLAGGADQCRADSVRATAKDSSSSARALINLVQGSWPSMHSAYQASMKHDPDGAIIMAAIERESAVMTQSPRAGLALIAHRMASRPGHYLWWYLSKPALLWDWDIRIGQGDVYVYPTRNSPFKSNVAFRAVGALCHSLNPWFFALAIVGALLALLPRQAPQPDQAAAALMFVFVTLVYSVLQAEPRYSVPFRGLEIVLSAFAAHRLRRYIGQKRTLAKIRATTTQQLPTLDDPIVESAPNPAPEPANDAAGILPPSTPSH